MIVGDISFLFQINNILPYVYSNPSVCFSLRNSWRSFWGSESGKTPSLSQKFWTPLKLVGDAKTQWFLFMYFHVENQNLKLPEFSVSSEAVPCHDTETQFTLSKWWSPEWVSWRSGCLFSKPLTSGTWFEILDLLFQEQFKHGVSILSYCASSFV